MRIVTFIFCLGLLNVGYAQETLPIPLKEVLVTAEGSVYPAGLAAKGVQGTVMLAAELNSEGRLNNVSVTQSSRSAELDTAALEAASILRYKINSNSDAVKPVVLPIRFNKDTVRSIPNKTCSDFNTDVAYFKQTFPEKAVVDMPSFDMTVGMLASLIKGDELLDLAKKLKPVKQEIVDICEKSPDRMYFEVALNAAKDK